WPRLRSANRLRTGGSTRARTSARSRVPSGPGHRPAGAGRGRAACCPPRGCVRRGTPYGTSRRHSVLVDEPAEDVDTTDAERADGEPRSRPVGNAESDASVGSAPVVVGEVAAKHPLQVVTPKHEDPVQALPTHRPDEAL